MLENGSLRNCCELGGRGGFGLAGREAAAAARRPAWVGPALSSVLIFTTVVDIVGNLLVVISVFKNRKLRNSGKGRGGGEQAGRGRLGGAFKATPELRRSPSLPRPWGLRPDAMLNPALEPKGRQVSPGKAS